MNAKEWGLFTRLHFVNRIGQIRPLCHWQREEVTTHIPERLQKWWLIMGLTWMFSQRGMSLGHRFAFGNGPVSKFLVTMRIMDIAPLCTKESIVEGHCKKDTLFVTCCILVYWSRWRSYWDFLPVTRNGIVYVTYVAESSTMPNPKMSKASKMVKRFMPNICFYQKGKELGNQKQGIFAPPFHWWEIRA